jgi:zinc transport system ATP-binding protein
MSLVTVQNLTFSYEKETILDSLSLTVDKGDFLAIIGPNGGGKSTLLKLLLGLLKSPKGCITLFGHDPSKKLKNLGYVPQNTNINIHFPIQVIEVVMMGERTKRRTLFGYSKNEIASATDALRQVGMEHFSQHKIGELSGGQRQRVMIARALYAHPKLLILDEPTSNIDSSGQKEIYELLKTLNQTITVVVVSHDISVILEYANKVAYINKTLSYHDISNRSKTFHTHNQQGHFCEVELLQMLAEEECQECNHGEKTS